VTGRTGRTFVGANLLAATVFLASALLQYNDPDPIRWIGLYGSAALACLAHDRLPGHRLLALAVAAVAFVWAATLAGVLPRMDVADLFRTMKAETPVIEESRELLGLLLVGVWMIFLLCRGRRKSLLGLSTRIDR
jgi:hypothetical protein